MAEKKISRKELLNEPDEFMTTTTKLIAYVRENPRVVGAAVGIVLAIAAAVLGYNAYKSQQARNSQELFQKVSREYQASVTAPEPPSPEKLDKLFAEFDVISKEYGHLPYGEMALLYSGHVLYQKQDYKGALERYEKTQGTGLVRRGLGPLVLYHIAVVRMALKDYEQAKELLDQLSGDTNSPYRREAFVSIARIYELMKKNKEAVQAYRQYLKMFPEAPDASFVKARIASLSDQG